MQGTAHDSLIGSPQGGLASPILANVYLHELDEKVQAIRLRLEQGGKQKQVNPLYRKLAAQKARLVQKGATRTKAFRELVHQIRSTPAVVVDDPTFIRIKYVRYADDWLIGIAGPRRLAEQVKEELSTFLSHHLKLTLSPEKTKITHARQAQARFLGTDLSIGRGGVPRVVTTRNGTARPIRRRSTGSETVMTAPRLTSSTGSIPKGSAPARDSQPRKRHGYTWRYVNSSFGTAVSTEAYKTTIASLITSHTCPASNIF